MARARKNAWVRGYYPSTLPLIHLPIQPSIHTPIHQSGSLLDCLPVYVYTCLSTPHMSLTINPNMLPGITEPTLQLHARINQSKSTNKLSEHKDTTITHATYPPSSNCNQHQHQQRLGHHQYLTLINIKKIQQWQFESANILIQDIIDLTLVRLCNTDMATYSWKEVSQTVLQPLFALSFKYSTKCAVE